jgi:hypothetical protein
MWSEHCQTQQQPHKAKILLTPHDRYFESQEVPWFQYSFLLHDNAPEGHPSGEWRTVFFRSRFVKLNIS